MIFLLNSVKQTQAALGIHTTALLNRFCFVEAGDQHKLLWPEAAAAATTLELQKTIVYS